MEEKRTCWLISRIPISFLVLVNSVNAFSIAAVSVLESTTRKFRVESGGGVTCFGYLLVVQVLILAVR